MRPSTPHYVLTTAHSIVYGRHFYATSNILQTVFGMVHCFIMNTAVTNALHDNTKMLLRRLMASWYSHYMDEGYGPCKYIP